jgi:hypothetical protein
MSDAQLIAFVTGFRDGIVGDGSPYGKCFMVCAPLVTLLCMHGVECTMVESMIHGEDFDNHVWLQLADGRVLDPTADQFSLGLPAVYLGPRLAIHRGV